MKLTVDKITDYTAPTEADAAQAPVTVKRPPIVNYPDEGFVTMTKAEWAAKPGDYKGVRLQAATETHGAYRYRRVMTAGCSLSTVYITDLKIVEIPNK